MPQRLRFDTRDLNASKRLDAWNDKVSASFVSCAVDADREFCATYETLSFGKCQLSRVTGDAARIELFSQSSLTPERRSFVLLAHDSGAAQYTVGKETFVVDRGEFVFVDMSNPWSVDIKDNDKDLYKLFMPQTEMLRLFPEAANLSGVRFSRTEGAGALLNSVWASTWQNGELLPAEANQLLLDAIQLLVSTSATENSAGHHRLMPKIMQFIDANIGCDDLSTIKIAQHVHASQRTVQLAFAQMKTTPIQYIRERRMEVAAQRLGACNLRISDIADELGYSDASLFSRHFNQRFKLSPLQFRKDQK